MFGEIGACVAKLQQTLEYRKDREMLSTLTNPVPLSRTIGTSDMFESTLQSINEINTRGKKEEGRAVDDGEAWNDDLGWQF